MDKVTLRRLQTLVGYAYENIPFYRSLYKRVGFVKRILMFENMMGTRMAPEDRTNSVYYEPFFLTSILGGFRTFSVGLSADSG